MKHMQEKKRKKRQAQNLSSWRAVGSLISPSIPCDTVKQAESALRALRSIPLACLAIPGHWQSLLITTAF